MRSIAASEVEGLVLGQVRRLLASPEVIARTIAAVCCENGATGRQPKGLRLAEVLGNGPLGWEEQRHAW